MSSWADIILKPSSPADAWLAIFTQLGEIAKTCRSPVDLHKQTVTPDRLLAETAWELWSSYPDAAPRTATRLQEWCSAPSSTGHAVLVVDALSLREMPLLLEGARKRDVQPSNVCVTGSEAPSNTDQFARALGVPSRSHLSGNRASRGFNLFPAGAYTDVISVPFEDAVGSIRQESNIFIWHTWLDDQVHVHRRDPNQIHNIASQGLRSDGFWRFVDRLRQGRKLVITSDHGYAVSELFSGAEIDEGIVEKLCENFGATRYTEMNSPWQERCMPPIVVSHKGYHIIMGQRKWKVQGGFPRLCHGGLSLLEVAVPFIELPAM